METENKNSSLTAKVGGVVLVGGLVLSGCRAPARYAGPSDIEVFNKFYAANQLSAKKPEKKEIHRNGLLAKLDARDQDTYVALHRLHKHVDSASAGVESLVKSIEFEFIGAYNGFDRDKQDKDQRQKGAENYKAWITKNAETLRNTATALRHLSNFEGELDARAFDRLRDNVKKLKDPNSAELVNVAINHYFEKAAALQPHLKRMIASCNTEAMFDQMMKYQALDDLIEKRETGESYTEVGKKVFDMEFEASDGGKYKLKAFLNSELDKIEKHLKNQDQNYWDDIMIDNRDAVAYHLWLKFKDKELDSKQLTGAIYFMDKEIFKRTAKEGDSATGASVASYLIRALPGAGAVDYFINQHQFLLTPETMADNKNVKTYKDMRMHAMLQELGAEVGLQYYKDKGPVKAQAIYNGVTTALNVAWILGVAKGSPSNSSSSSNGGGSGGGSGGGGFGGGANAGNLGGAK